MIGFNQLEISLSLSAFFYYALLTLHLSAVVALTLTDLNLYWFMLLMLAIVSSFHRCLNEYWLGTQSIDSLTFLTAEKRWFLTDHYGSTTSIHQVHHVTVLKCLLIVHYKHPSGQRQWLIIPKDAIDANLFRRLSVILLYQAPE